jgi:hypothetical protein
MSKVGKLPLYEVLDYLTISKQEHNIDEMKNSKSLLPL